MSIIRVCLARPQQFRTLCILHIVHLMWLYRLLSWRHTGPCRTWPPASAWVGLLSSQTPKQRYGQPPFLDTSRLATPSFASHIPVTRLQGVTVRIIMNVEPQELPYEHPQHRWCLHVPVAYYCAAATGEAGEGGAGVCCGGVAEGAPGRPRSASHGQASTIIQQHWMSDLQPALMLQPLLVSSRQMPWRPGLFGLSDISCDFASGPRCAAP